MRASKTVVWVVGSIIGIIVVLLAFRTGMVIGYRQGQYSVQWQHFHNGATALSANRANFFQIFANPNDVMNDHGAIGTIVAVGTTTATGTSFIVHDIHDAINKTIYVFSTTTVVNRGGTTPSTPAPLTAFRVGQGVMVIGIPGGQGQILANIIHLLPAAPPIQ